ncbi:MAG: hypothetical protein J2P57_16655 [Acidimicrobiaceae bacterium]|nr:hypothetical protein [Acidimicrobiaceae bacterium]
MTTTPVAVVTFAAGAGVSLATSWVLVSRLERIGGRLRASEAMLGLLAALAADAPEITSSISALTQHQQTVSVGVVLGSNVFNLAALLGLGAVVAGRIALHRRVVMLEGGIGIWVAAAALLAVLHLVLPVVALALVLAVLIPYVVFSGLSSSTRRRLSATRLQRWMGLAVAEEELELVVAIHPRRGRSADYFVASAALVIVVAASVAMERAGTTLGQRFSVPDIVVGTILLAAVTSLPNAVAGVYLARRGRGAASLSTTLNSNAINITAGFLLPGAILGIGRASANATLVACWSGGLTLLLVGFAWRDRGLGRATGATIIAVYGVFVVMVFATASRTTAASPSTYLLAVLPTFAVASMVLIWPRRPAAVGGEDPGPEATALSRNA